MSTAQILEELEHVTGSNAKRAILVKQVENGLLRDVFRAAQDPYVTYYVNKFKMPQPTEGFNGDETLIDFLDFITLQLATRAITGNAAKAATIEKFSRMNELSQKWCLRILLKNLRCGVQETSVNKVWPGTIKSFAVQLANVLLSTYEKGIGIVLKEHPKYPLRVEPKLDGLRCVAVKKDGIVTLFTRGGSVLETLPSIKAALVDGQYDNVVLDAEAIAQDWNESASVMMSHKVLKDDTNMRLNVFDALPIEHWIEQKSDALLPYQQRIQLVADVLKSLPANSPVKQVMGVTVNSDDELLAFYATVMNEGYEGIMLKDLKAAYVFKRSDAVLKLKPITSFEGMIIGWYNGRRGSKREGIFGGFEVLLPNRVITRVGGGFNDQFRAEVQLEGPDAYVGRIMEIEGQPDPMTKDGLTVDGKVRFPVYLRMRDCGDVDRKVIETGETYMLGTE